MFLFVCACVFLLKLFRGLGWVLRILQLRLAGFRFQVILIVVQLPLANIGHACRGR